MVDFSKKLLYDSFVSKKGRLKNEMTMFDEKLTLKSGMATFKEEVMLEHERSKYKKYCEHCGHTMTFYSYERDKKICSWCGNLNYRNDLVKFKELLKKAQKEVKCFK